MRHAAGVDPPLTTAGGKPASPNACEPVRQVGAQLRQRRILLREVLADVARVERDPVEAERRQRVHAARDRDRLVRRGHADSPHSHVDFHVDIHLAPNRIGGFGHRLDGFDRVDRDGEANVRVDREDAAQLCGADGRMREEQVVAGVRHDLELARRRARQASGPESQLLGGNARRLVRLHVRTQREAVQDAIGGHAIEVVRQAIEIHQGGGSLELFEQLWSDAAKGHGRTTLVADCCTLVLALVAGLDAGAGAGAGSQFAGAPFGSSRCLAGALFGSRGVWQYAIFGSWRFYRFTTIQAPSTT